jgi:hypothetical protein
VEVSFSLMRIMNGKEDIPMRMTWHPPYEKILLAAFTVLTHRDRVSDSVLELGIHIQIHYFFHSNEILFLFVLIDSDRGLRFLSVPLRSYPLLRVFPWDSTKMKWTI